MIFDGQQCEVFGSVKTVIDMQMRLTKDSAGTPKWYDYGKEYDNTKISFTLVSEEPANLEKIVREQYQGSSISVEFQDGEWLYDVTDTFVVLSYKINDRLDHEFTSYGLDVTIAPTAYIDYSLLAGDRTECDGAGYLTYSGTKIPQPKDFNFKYNTHKYAGVTHGSAYSSELQTIERDETSFEVEMLAGNMRSLVDKLYTNRGNAIQVTFPAYTFPFGLARGSDESLNHLCTTSIDTITIESTNSFLYKTTLGLIELKSGEVPTETVYYYEGGTTEHQFTSTNWANGGGGTVDFLPSDITLTTISSDSPPNAYTICNYTGIVSSAFVKVKDIEVNSASFSTWVLGLADVGGTGDAVVIFYKHSTQEMAFYIVMGGVVEVVYKPISIGNGFSVESSCVIENTTDIILSSTVYDALGVLVGTVSHTFLGKHSGVPMGARVQTGNVGVTVWDEFYIEGTGFPYSKEVPIV